jgi:UDP-N-acetyl-2-amino-2-deoxyglucuronate dehydrogenase
VIRVGVVGVGAIAPFHLEAYLTFPLRCAVVALADIVPEKCPKAVERFGLEAACFESHRQLLDEADVDLVSVCTPPGTHAEIAIDVLRSGRHVLVEKPMAASLEECDAMLAAKRQSGKLLSVIAQNRFRTDHWRLAQLFASGAAGKVLHAQVDSLWWRGPNYYDLWWRGTWEGEGGGPTLNHAVHHIDLLLWMMGAPVEVRAMMANVAHENSEVEDLSSALLRFPGGALGQLTSSVVHHGQQQQMVFQAERARISAPFECYASRPLPNGFPERDRAVEAELTAAYEATPPLAHEGHVGQINDVLAALEGVSEPLIDGQQGRRTIELITAIYKSAITGQAVGLPLEPEDAFYRKEGLLGAAPRYHKKARAVADFGEVPITTTGG